MAPFALSDIERSFTLTILDRGRDYVRRGKVLHAFATSLGEIKGNVRGSEGQIYDVELWVDEDKKRIEIVSECTCPYSIQCKHGAALALYAVNHELETMDLDDEDDEEPLELAELSMPEPSQEIPLPKEIGDWLDRVVHAGDPRNTFDPADKARLFYILSTRSVFGGIEVPTVKAVTRSILKTGEFGTQGELKASAVSLGNYPKFLNIYDRALMVDLEHNSAKLDWQKAEYRLDGEHGARLLEKIVRSGRSYWHSTSSGKTLELGQLKSGKIVWLEAKNGMTLQPTVDFGSDGAVLSVLPPWYVEFSTGLCGPLDCGKPPETVAAFLRTAPIRPEHLPAVRTKLESMGMSGTALPEAKLKPVIRAPIVTPCLSVRFETCNRRPHYWSSSQVSAPVAFAHLTFEYDGHKTPTDESDIRIVEGDQILILRRNHRAEESAKQTLLNSGWRDPAYSGWDYPAGRRNSLCIVPPDDYRLHEPIERVNGFIERLFPQLKAQGWKIDVEQNFRFVADEDIEWDLGVEGGSGIDWFEFQLGIRVEGQPFDLKAVLQKLFAERQGQPFRYGQTAGLPESDDMYVFGVDGRTVKLSRKRLNAILQPLVELFGGVKDWPDDLRLPKALLSEASRLEETIEDAGLPWRTSDELKSLSSRLAAFDHLEPVMEPEGFVGELRGYQREGLSWLQFLREYGFGGVLADDMGLGKTVQVLAFLQAEKNEGRMDRPCLIVAPTSTMPNWRRECERFTPGLSVTTLQGAGRHGKYAKIKDFDVALTTYPLIARDKDYLMQQPYHVIVLDEAQNVKNPVTASARAAQKLVGRHRICMSGTPVENHLGELWSLFHFLMPSFLGTDPDFKRRFRTPIEKSGDNEARERLKRRIRPFMLRRTKVEVVKELPPKTEIIETVAFDDPQRDLYESIRVAMDAQVQTLIASQGFDKSRFQILDALLKLRQVCCDPRLVKLPSARSVTVSAKLDRLLEMLTVLLEDGRKVLLFSQFTSMLNLIEERLRAASIEWVRISGDTIDRDTPVRRFQAGEVPLFLISLKAGGTGLNLTAADTVILYDPWWNPAVENQAIDRAHRIGQEKAVMVYKLVAAGTIEEKMLEMQVRKGDLAKSILTEDVDSIGTLTSEDLRWILAKD